MLDERSHKEALENQIKACPNCARIQSMKDHADHRRQVMPRHLTNMNALSLPMNADDSPITRVTKKMRHTAASPLASGRITPTRTTELSTPPPATSGKKLDLQSFESPPLHEPLAESTPTQLLLISPMTTEILGRQYHTRHSSMDFGGNINYYPGTNLSFNSRANTQRVRNFSMDIPATVDEGVLTNVGPPPRPPNQSSEGMHLSDPSVATPFTGLGSSSDTSSYDSGDVDSIPSVKDAVEEEYSGVKNAKYIFLTLREALINSMVIIAFGCLGFCLIEGLSVIDSWYFTTVLLTTVVSWCHQTFFRLLPFFKSHMLFALAGCISGIWRYLTRNRYGRFTSAYFKNLDAII
jgi:hypothetical protein